MGKLGNAEVGKQSDQGSVRVANNLAQAKGKHEVFLWMISGSCNIM
jgi:hypothetical protein